MRAPAPGLCASPGAPSQTHGSASLPLLAPLLLRPGRSGLTRRRPSLRTGRKQASAEAPLETTFYQNHQGQERTLGALRSSARFVQKTGGQEGLSGRDVLQPGDLRFLREMTASTPRPSPAAGPAPARGLCTGRCARGRRPVGAPPPVAASVLNIHGDRYFLKGEPPRGSSPPRAGTHKGGLGSARSRGRDAASRAARSEPPCGRGGPGNRWPERSPLSRREWKSDELGGGGRARSLSPEQLFSNQLRVLRRGSRPGAVGAALRVCLVPRPSGPGTASESPCVWSPRAHELQQTSP